MLATAERRGDGEVLFAQRQLVEWKHTTGARARSTPQRLHRFEDS